MPRRGGVLGPDLQSFETSGTSNHEVRFGDQRPSEDVDWGTSECASDPRRAYDALRDRSPVAKSAVDGSWMVLGHEAVSRCARDASSLSNRVSSRLQIPNGLDGDEHRRFRALVDGFLGHEPIVALVPGFQAIAEELARGLPLERPVDVVSDIGAPLAVRFQCTWLGWPPQLEPRLLAWLADYRAVLRGDDVNQRAAVAQRFDALVAEQLRERRARDAASLAGDVTSELMRSCVADPAAPGGGGRPLTDDEIISILRNWTAGDLGTIAACVGVVVHRIAADPQLQAELRSALDADDPLDLAIDECLRIDDPFLWNRRVARREIEVAGRRIPAGAKVLLNWAAANRDPLRFGDPDQVRSKDNAPHNLVYGAGPHACPGRELATVQLRVALAALLRAAPVIRLAEREPQRSHAPAGGFESVWIVLSSPQK